MKKLIKTLLSASLLLLATQAVATEKEGVNNQWYCFIPFVCDSQSTRGSGGGVKPPQGN